MAEDGWTPQSKGGSVNTIFIFTDPLNKYFFRTFGIHKRRSEVELPPSKACCLLTKKDMCGLHIPKSVYEGNVRHEISIYKRDQFGIGAVNRDTRKNGGLHWKFRLEAPTIPLSCYCPFRFRNNFFKMKVRYCSASFELRSISLILFVPSDIRHEMLSK